MVIRDRGAFALTKAYMKRVVGEKDAIWRRARAFVFFVFRNSSVVLTTLLGHAYVVAERGIGGGRMVVAFFGTARATGAKGIRELLAGKSFVVSSGEVVLKYT
jgi:hypothetical protein